MKPLAGWDGPKAICEGIWRYSKTIFWIRLHIDVVGSDFFGGTCACSRNFEIEKEDGHWKRFETDLARSEDGELILRLRGYTTWDVVYERIGEGRIIDAGIETIEDMAEYLEKCVSSGKDE